MCQFLRASSLMASVTPGRARLVAAWQDRYEILDRSAKDTLNRGEFSVRIESSSGTGGWHAVGSRC